MSRRLRVLLSAFSCEPHKGSEPEVGWQWALQVARFHDVTVLTQSKNRVGIERALALLPGQRSEPRFVYHDLHENLRGMRLRPSGLRLYHILWQKSARDVVQQLHQENKFDLMHHVTLAGFRYPTAIWGHGVPCIWGPVGGIENAPLRLLSILHPVSFLHEFVRNSHNLLQHAPFNILVKRLGSSTLPLASTNEMRAFFKKMGFEVRVMPTIGLNPRELPFRAHQPHVGPLRLLFVGNIIALKGLHLAVEALAAAGTDATLTIVGSGDYETRLRVRAERLGVAKQLIWLGRLPREKVLELYPDYDVLLFPSLHDTGGYAVIEAMFNALPVICLDSGGPAVAVGENCGVKIPLTSHAQVVAGLAMGIRLYHQERERLSRDGKAARQRVLEEYDWDKKGAQMNECYLAAMEKFQSPNSDKASNAHSGIGSFAIFLSRVLSFRGLAATGLGLFLIGALGFFSVSRLKADARTIIEDTLPGLSYAGEANASLAQAFNRTLLLLNVDNPEQRAQIEREVDLFSQRTTRLLQAYKRQIYSAQELAVFNQMQARREDYLRQRLQTMSLIHSNRHQEAVAHCKSQLLPAYNRYKEAGDKLFEYNMHQGQSRGRIILTVCTITQLVVAGVGILIFLAGFLLGVSR